MTSDNTRDEDIARGLSRLQEIMDYENLASGPTLLADEAKLTTFDDFEDEVLGLLDEQIEEDTALAIVREMRGVLGLGKDKILSQLRKAGITDIGGQSLGVYFATYMRPHDVFDLKYNHNPLFNALAKLLCQRSNGKYANIGIIYSAFIRFEVMHVMANVRDIKPLDAESNDISWPELIHFGYGMYLVGLLSMTTYIGNILDDEKAISALHKIQSRQHISGRWERRKHNISEHLDLAHQAWEHGCELLHTQIAELLKIALPPEERDRRLLLGSLKALDNSRVFGLGGLGKTVRRCPCEKSAGCRLAEALPGDRYFEL